MKFTYKGRKAGIMNRQRIEPGDVIDIPEDEVETFLLRTDFEPVTAKPEGTDNG